jgi:hypothetical protein
MTSREKEYPLFPQDRDLRLDFFRGIGQWMIFLDHIPFDVVNWLTFRNYGFSDAAELFVFISGYTAGFVYGPAMREGRTFAATARLLKRVWQIYVAHVFLFVFFIAYIAQAAEHYDNPMLAHEFNIFNFLRHPDVMLMQGLVLKFKPVDLDVLPLYIVLLLASPVILWVMARRPGLILLGSAVLYVVARALDWNLPSFPTGSWYFNPITWQLLFVLGMWCALGGFKKLAPLIASRGALVLAVGYLAFAFLIVMTWHVPSWARLVPPWLAYAMYPIDKTNLDPLRLVHFLAMAVLAVRYIPRNWSALTARWSQPLILCGQHSLPIFVLGTFLSFAAHIFLVEISNRVIVQILVSFVGIVLMVAAARLMTWYKKKVRAQFQPQEKSAPAGAVRMTLTATHGSEVFQMYLTDAQG